MHVDIYLIYCLNALFVKGYVFKEQKNMERLKRIVEECFWDMNMSIDDIQKIISGSDFKKKEFLFEKILVNSTRVLLDLKIFKKDELKLMIENFNIPIFNHDYIFRRKNIVEVYFFNKPLLVEELKWEI